VYIRQNIITVQLLHVLHHALLAAVTDKTTMLWNVQFIVRTLLAPLAGLLRRTLWRAKPTFIHNYWYQQL